ncbi:MAG: hypothetical protein JWM11_3591 [Planctomycetaceae bacterium]|nr:hypothetical protein [Planctomycetaceae bacterium]
MQQENPWHLALNSGRFKILCQFLNRTTPNTDATLHYDVMSGGYRFSDESPPDSLRDFDQELILPLITLLRFLWAYRLSVVHGTPRNELAEWWHSTKVLAPNWSGFSPERVSENGIQFATFCDARQKEWEEGVEAFERQLQNPDL